MNKKNVAIMQARMGSSRLPGKTLIPLHNNIPLLQLVIERVKRAKNIDDIIIATSVNKENNEIEKLCNQLNINCFRGSEDDVLDRVYQAATHFNATDTLVRITADCPLHDPKVIDSIISFFQSENLDFASNVDPPTFPDGLDTEVFTYKALEESWKLAKKQEEREHVTTFIKRNRDKFKQKNLSNSKDLSSHHWTLDTEEDLKFVRHIYTVFYDKNPEFGMVDVLEYLEENPELQSLTDGWTHLIR